VTLITTAFEVAARARAHILGVEKHPIVAMRHPLASKTPAEVKIIAEEIVESIACGLVEKS
jgi:hypothetical protein